MSALEEVLPAFVKNTFLVFEDDRLQDPRRCASEPPRHRHHDRAAKHPKPLHCVDCTSDVSGSTRTASPRGSLMDDSVSDEGCLGSESGDISLPIRNAPASSLPLSFDRTWKPQSFRSPAPLGNANSVPQSGWHHNKNIVGDRINMFEALHTSSQQVGVLQSQREFIMTSGKSVFRYEVDTTCSAEVCTRRKKQSEASQCVGRSKEYEKPQLKGKHNAAPRTLMICHLPCRLVYDDLIEAINSVGFGDAFEFVHLPCRLKLPGSNLGYAFINFFSPADAALFAIAFEGYHFSHKGSTKVCSVKVARSQGFDGNYRRKQRSFGFAKSK